MKTFPMLYKKAASGAIVEWQISVDGATITTVWGQQGGKKQTGVDVIKEGKNLGRANATTPEEQAMAEAEAQWTKKKKKDMVEDLSKAGEASELIEGGILPMLAKKFSEDGDKLKYPCYVQCKLDGHRCIAVIDDAGKCTLWSRTRKPINSLPHIVKAIEALKLKNVVLDGEAYNHSYKNRFEELTHFIRQSKPEAGCEIVEYHIYDIADNERTFLTRNLTLEAYKLKRPLVHVDTRQAANEDELMLAFEDYLALGYEGAMARNTTGKYVNKRSADLLKIKQFSDAEYKCIGVEEGRGKLAGHAIFVLVTAEGKEFRAKLKGDTTELKKYFDNPETVVGHDVTVKYQGVSSYGIPRFPVALRVRENI